METLLKISAHDNAAVKQYRQAGTFPEGTDKDRIVCAGGLSAGVGRCEKRCGADTAVLDRGRSARWQAEGLPDVLHGTRCALVSDSLAAELSQTEHTQGVFAVCQIPDPPALSALIHTGGSYAVLHQLQDPGNAGMILRTADALGLDGVIYSASCDIYSPKVVRATMGSLFRVPLCCVPEIEPVLAACRDAGVESCAAVVSGQAELVGQCLFRKGTAVVIGNEGNGLPEEVSAACDRRVTIPMHGTIESLNAAMAAGIILWEVQKAAAAGNGGQ